MSSDDRFDDHLDDDLEDSSDDDLEDHSSDDHSDHVIGSTGSSTDANEDHSSDDHADDSVTSSRSSSRGRSRGRGASQGRGRGRDDLASDSVASSSTSDSIDDSTNDSSKTMGKTSSGKPPKDKPGKGGSSFTNTLNATAMRDPVNGPFEAIATAARDELIGNSSTSIGTFFTWQNLTDSVLKGPRRSVLWDQVDNFRTGLDGLDVPANIDAEAIQAITTTSGSVDKLVAGQINAKGVGPNFAPNTVAAFTQNGVAGTFVVFNDSRPGYQQESDGLVFLKGFILSSTNGIGIY